MAEPTRVDVSRQDGPQGHRRRGRPHLHPRDHRGLQLDRIVGCAGQRRRGPGRQRRRRRRSRSAATARIRARRRASPTSPRRSRPRRASRPRSTPSTTAASRTRSRTTSARKPDTAYTWFSGFRMKFFADQGFNVPIDDVWAKVKDNYSEGFAQSVVGQRQEGLRDPGRLLPVGRLLPQERLRGQGVRHPQDLGRPQGPVHQDADGWPHPDRLRRQGRLAGDGHVRHPQPPAQRLRLPRRPDGRHEQVDRPQGHGRLPEVGGDPAVPRQGLRRPEVAGRRQHAGPEEVRACTCSALFVSEQFLATKNPADLADLDFFAFPTLGTQYDAEAALDAPIDTWQIAAKSPSLATEQDAAKAFLEFWAKGSTQVLNFKNAAGRDPDRQGRGYSRPSPTSRRRPPRSSAAPSGSPSSSTATRAPTSPGRTACRASSRSSWPTRPRTSPPTRRPSRTSGMRCLRSSDLTVS